MSAPGVTLRKLSLIEDRLGVAVRSLTCSIEHRTWWNDQVARGTMAAAEPYPVAGTVALERARDLVMAERKRINDLMIGLSAGIGRGWFDQSADAIVKDLINGA